VTSNVFQPNFTVAMESRVNAGAGHALRVSKIPEKNARLLPPRLHPPVVRRCATALHRPRKYLDDSEHIVP
jgi:hypothetical protein